MVAATRPLSIDPRFERAHPLETPALGDRIANHLLFASVGCYLFVSSMMLSGFGFHYGDAGGTALEKVHPGTWLLLMAITIKVGTKRNPLQAVGTLFAHPTLALYLMAWATLLVFTIVVLKQPFTPLIDTFLTPPLLFAMGRDLDLRDEKRFCRLIHVAMVANALLGILELKAGFKFTPDSTNELAQFDWRSFAFLGHPLSNAMMTGCYILIIALSDRTHLPKGLVPLVILVELNGMVSFGGRASLVVTIAILFCIGGVGLMRILMGAPFSRLRTALILVGIPFAVLALALVIQSGFFDLLIERFKDDNGSAKARIIMLEIFRYLSPMDLIIAPDNDYVASLQMRLGIELGIESFWVSFLLHNGVIMSLVFFTAMGLLTLLVIRKTRPASMVVFLFFYFVASTSVTMSAKTTLFGLFTFMLMVMMRPVLAAPARLRFR